MYYVDVMHALRDIDRVDRAALRLIYWGGRTQAQTAHALNLPESTIREHVARGMREVAAYIENGSQQR